MKNQKILAVTAKPGDRIIAGSVNTVCCGKLVSVMSLSSGVYVTLQTEGGDITIKLQHPAWVERVISGE